MSRAEDRFRRQIRKVNRRSARAEARSAYAISPEAFTAPRGLPEINRDAGVAADLVYGGALNQNALQGKQIPAWFADYMTTVKTPEQVATQYAPAIQQSQQNAQQTGQTLGLEGAAGEQDQLAAKAREALANLGTSVLSNAQQADTSYYQGRQGVAQAAQIGALTQNSTDRTKLISDRDAFRAQYVADARDRERAYGIDLRHQANEDKAFGLDVYKAQQGAAGDAAARQQERREKQRDRRDKQQEVNKYGYTNEQWSRFSPSHRQRIMREQDASPAKPKTKPGLTIDQKRAKRKDKEERQRRDSFIEATIRNPPTYPKNHPKAGKSPTRAEIIDQLVKKGYSRQEIKKVLRRMYPYQQRQGTAPSRDQQPG